MATIVVQAGKFLVRVRVKGSRPVAQSFNSRRAAIAWGAETEDAIRRGIYQYGSATRMLTLGEALTEYGKTVTPRKRGAKQERYVLAVLNRLPTRNRPLDQFTSADMAALRDAWIKTVSASTIQKRMALLSHLYTTARREWGLTIDNPMQDVPKPLVANRRERVASPKELNAVLAVSSDTVASLARLACASAARLGELVALKWEYVDLAARVMTFPMTKNGTARTVPLVPAAIDLLTGMKPEGRATGPVFHTNVQNVSVAWRKAVARARRAYEEHCAEIGEVPDEGYLVDLHFHDLRHTAITEFAEHGLSTLKLAAISGHKTVGMLARYTHINASRLAAELADLEGTRT
jgi:integrase